MAATQGANQHIRTLRHFWNLPVTKYKRRETRSYKLELWTTTWILFPPGIIWNIFLSFTNERKILVFIQIFYPSLGFIKNIFTFPGEKKFTHENKKKYFKMFHTFHTTFFYSWNFLRPKIFSPEKGLTHEREICFSPEKFSFHLISYDEFFNREKNYFLQFFFFFLKSPELFFSFFLLVSYPNIFLSLWKRNPFSNTIYFPPGRKRLLVFTRDFFHFPEKKRIPNSFFTRLCT